MATVGLYGSSSSGVVAAASGSESTGLYGNSTSFGGSYFEWFIFQVADTQPATPTGGSWDFSTNSGVPPTGWTVTPPSAPTNTVWVSIALVNSKTSATLTWSAPGKFSYASGLPIISGSGTPGSGVGQSDQLYIQLDTNPQTIWFKETGTWTRLTGSSLYVDLTSNQTIAGTKTFSSQIQGSVSGTAANVTGIVAVANGGTGVTTSTGSGNVVLSNAPTLNNPTISNYEAFAPSSTPAYTEGVVWYDSASNALAYYNNTTNNVVHIGQEIQQQVRNSTGVTITKGQVVYISGSTGQIGNVILAQANAYISSQVIGVANQDIPNNTNGWIVTQGTVSNINTSGFTAGNPLYLSATTAGAMTQTEPNTPNYAVHMGVCLYSNTNNGKIYICPINKSIDTGYIIGQVAVAQGGTGTSTPSLVAGTNVSITGTWPNQTINSSNPGGTVTSVAATVPSFLSVTGSPITSSGTLAIGYSGTALPVLNGGTGVTTSTGSGSVVLNTSPTLVTPALGTPTSGNFSTGTFTWPTFNQNTTGTASNVTGTVAIANGGTGQTTAAAAITALAGTQVSGTYLRSNGVSTSLSTIQVSDVPTLNQNTTGTAANITATSNSTLTTLSALSLPGSQVSGNIAGNAANVTGTVAIANGGTGATTAAAARTNLGATTVGGNLFTLTNPSAITFPRFNADNTVSALDAATFRTAIGAGTSSTTGTVTSVAATVPAFLSISGSPITSSGTLAISLSGTALPTANGGTGLTSFTANGVVYASGAGTLATGSALTFDGTLLALPRLGQSGSGNYGYFNTTSAGNGFLSFQYNSSEVGEIGQGSGIISGGSNTDFGIRATNNLLFSISYNEQMRLTTTGLGIGTSSPAPWKLNVNQSGSSLLNLLNTSGTGTQIQMADQSWSGGLLMTAGNLVFQTGGLTERARIDSSGNLGLGVTPSAWDSFKAMQFGAGGLAATVASNTALTANAYWGTSNWRYTTANAASLFQQVDGAFTWKTAPSGTAGNAISFTQAMTLSAAGVWSLGDTGTVASSYAGVKFNGASYNGLGLNDSSSTSGVGFVYFQIGGTTIGSITRVAATSSVAYNTVSDQRLKENIIDAPEFGSVIDSIKVRSYDWKADGNHQRAGFIAQELVAVAPEAVHQPEDPEQMMAVDYSKLVPMLVKEIQSLRARVAQLEGK